MKNKEKIDISYITDGDHDGSNGTKDYGIFQSRELMIGMEIEMETVNNEEEDNGQHQPRKVTHPTTYLDTLLHIFKGNIGSGLFAMGDAFKNGGIVFSPIMTAILGIISVHAQHLLLNCSDDMYKQSKLKDLPNFPETVGLCFATGPLAMRKLARSMELLVNVLLCITQLGFCCVYIVFVATNIQLICDQYVKHFELSAVIAFVLIPVILLCMVRNVKTLTPVSTSANVIMAIGVGAVMYEATTDLPQITTRKYLANWQQLPLFFGTVIYAFEGIGLVLPLKNVMKKPEQFQKPLGVLNVGMITVGFIIIIVGFFGYLKWGEQVQGSLTLNLKPDHWLSSTVQGLIALAMLLTYPLQFYVPINITWPYLLNKFNFQYPVISESLYRAIVVIFTFVIAETIPQLGLFISLVGAISSTALALIFPPILELVTTSQKSGGCSIWVITKDTLIILLGVFIFVTGTYESIASIIRAFAQ